MRAIARRRKLLVAGLPGAFGNAASVRARRREPGSTFVRSSKWDADQVCDDVRGYVVEHLYDDQAVLVVDETGDVK